MKNITIKHCGYISLAFLAALVLCYALVPPEVKALEDGPETYIVDGSSCDIYGEFYR